ncbi:LysR family transcriptional regulator [Streptomyces lutosisoli]|uniref:LysR family transcriptional regulator n=1 Tax=Streptomyces lutosisoli TaxID=2665721 RepID=A0ABW2VZD3_9ACTN
MELPALDLNLIVVLHALLEERNVTRAGERVGLSQPAASAALGRLRRHFDDPLLERKGTHYELTPVAQGLRAELGDTVERVSRLLTARPRFEPESSSRRFRVHCSDSVLTVLGPALVTAVQSAAPDVRLDFEPVDPGVIHDPLTRLAETNVLVLARGLLSDLPSSDLYTDGWVCVAWEGNTVTPGMLSFEDAPKARWVVPYAPSPLASPADAHLAALGVDRRATVTVQSFTALGRLVVGSDLLALVHERVLRASPGLPLRRVILPVPLPAVSQAAWWHPSHQLDPGHRWLLGIMAEVAGGLKQL